MPHTTSVHPKDVAYDVPGPKVVASLAPQKPRKLKPTYRGESPPPRTPVDTYPYGNVDFHATGYTIWSMGSGETASTDVPSPATTGMPLRSASTPTLPKPARVIGAGKPQVRRVLTQQSQLPPLEARGHSPIRDQLLARSDAQPRPAAVRAPSSAGHVQLSDLIHPERGGAPDFNVRSLGGTAPNQGLFIDSTRPGSEQPAGGAPGRVERKKREPRRLVSPRPLEPENTTGMVMQGSRFEAKKSRHLIGAL